MISTVYMQQLGLARVNARCVMNSQRVSDDVHRLQRACEILLTEAGERIARSDDRQLGALVQLARQRTRALFELSARLAARIDERRDLLLQAVRLSRLASCAERRCACAVCCASEAANALQVSFFTNAVGAFERLELSDEELASGAGGESRTLEQWVSRVQRDAEEALPALRQGRILLTRVASEPGADGVRQCVRQCKPLIIRTLILLVGQLIVCFVSGAQLADLERRWAGLEQLLTARRQQLGALSADLLDFERRLSSVRY